MSGNRKAGILEPPAGLSDDDVREWRKGVFLNALEECVPIVRAARIAGTTEVTMRAWREKDPGFAFAWDEAYEAGTAMLESEMVRRAVEGVEEDVYYQGKVVGTKHKPSDTLLVQLVKARRPDVYGEKVRLPGGVAPRASRERIESTRASGASAEHDKAIHRAREQKELTEGRSTG